jgi:hypothetical protein
MRRARLLQLELCRNSTARWEWAAAWKIARLSFRQPRNDVGSVVADFVSRTASYRELSIQRRGRTSEKADSMVSSGGGIDDDLTFDNLSSHGPSSAAPAQVGRVAADQRAFCGLFTEVCAAIAFPERTE